MNAAQSLELVRRVFLWCTVINCAMLVGWFLLYALPHEWLTRIWAKWFHLTAEQFDTINFAGIVFYEVAILVLNLVPYLALSIVA